MYYASCACLRSLACSFLREYVKMQTQIELIRKFVERENSLLIFIIHEIMINIVIYLSLQFRCILKNFNKQYHIKSNKYVYRKYTCKTEFTCKKCIERNNK